MKNKIKMLLAITVFAVIGLSLVGCDEAKDSYTNSYTYSFINNSSYTVNIDCPDLNPSKFSVSPSTFKRATSSKTYIQIIYTPANYVKGVAGDGSFTFTNK